MYTSDLKNAGTDAGISINLQGERGETGYVPLLANYDTFERGQVRVQPECCMENHPRSTARSVLAAAAHHRSLRCTKRRSYHSTAMLCFDVGCR